MAGYAANSDIRPNPNLKDICLFVCLFYKLYNNWMVRQAFLGKLHICIFSLSITLYEKSPLLKVLLFLFNNHNVFSYCKSWKIFYLSILTKFLYFFLSKIAVYFYFIFIEHIVLCISIVSTAVHWLCIRWWCVDFSLQIF